MFTIFSWYITGPWLQLLATFKVIVTVFVTPPPAAVTVRFEVPTFAAVPRVSVKVLLPLPGAAMLCGLKLGVTPLGTPDTEIANAAVNPPTACVVRVTVAFPAGCSVTVLALAAKVKLGTFTVILAV